MIRELNRYLIGWVGYFHLAVCQDHLRRLDSWIRRKLRCVQLKYCKRVYTIARFLTRLGVREHRAWCLALSGNGWWNRAKTPQAHQAMSTAWFTQLGLTNLVQRYVALNR
jgi:RNA-directed DNA polymerase